MNRKGCGFIFVGIAFLLAGCGGSRNASSTGLEDLDSTFDTDYPVPDPTIDNNSPLGDGIPTPLAARKARATAVATP